MFEALILVCGTFLYMGFYHRIRKSGGEESGHESVLAVLLMDGQIGPVESGLRGSNRLFEANIFLKRISHFQWPREKCTP